MTQEGQGNDQGCRKDLLPVVDNAVEFPEGDGKEGGGNELFGYAESEIGIDCVSPHADRGDGEQCRDGAGQWSEAEFSHHVVDRDGIESDAQNVCQFVQHIK